MEKELKKLKCKLCLHTFYVSADSILLSTGKFKKLVGIVMRKFGVRYKCPMCGSKKCTVFAGTIRKPIRDINS